MSANAISPQAQAGSAAATSNRIAQEGVSINTPQVLEKEADEIQRAEQQTTVQEVVASREAINDEVDVMNQVADVLNRELSFDVRDKTGEVFVRVVDKETGEVIREIPPEELVALSERIREAVGLIFEGEA